MNVSTKSSAAGRGAFEDLAMQGKVCIVTGANAGIGKEVTKGLLAQGANVVMACRNMALCEQARSELEALHLPGTAECSQLDLTDMASVRRFAQRQRQCLSDGSDGGSSGARSSSDGSEGNSRSGGGGAASDGWHGIDVLVNNAGVMGVPPLPDGSDVHLVANHLGPFLLTRLLLPAMAPGGRIVNVASRAHKWGSVEVDEQHTQLVNPPKHWFLQYTRSKLCNVLFTAELQRRLSTTSTSSTTNTTNTAATTTLASSAQGTTDSPAASSARVGAPLSSGAQLAPGILATSVSPGLVASSIFRYLPTPVQWLMKPAIPLLFRTPAQGADTVIFAATAPTSTLLALQSTPSTSTIATTAASTTATTGATTAATTTRTTATTCDSLMLRQPPLLLHDRKPLDTLPAAHDEQLALALWEASEALTGLTADEVVK